MTADIKWVLDTIISRGICPAGTRWFLFGSVSRLDSSAADIDLLIVYRGIDVPGTIRKSISNIALERPLHLTFMTPDEVEQTNFIEQQEAKEIFPGPSHLCRVEPMVEGSIRRDR